MNRRHESSFRIRSRIQAWRRMMHGRLQLEYGLRLSRSYRRILRNLQAIHFWVLKRIWAGREWKRFQLESMEIIGSLLRAVIGQMLFAILLVTAMELLGPFAVAYTVQIHVDSTQYFGILSGLIQLSGVFIGLYFTAVSVVATTAYRDASAGVRSLLIREKISSRYFRIVALLGGTSLMILVMQTLGYPPSILNLAMVSVLGALAIFSFVVMGLKMIDFLDPSQLTRYLANETIESIKSVSPSGFMWKNNVIQSLHQRVAERALSTYQNIIKLATSRESQVSGIDLAAPALAVLRVYADAKPRIPTESYWFKRSYGHQDWLTADFTRLDLALRTSTSLLPDLIPNLSWFEKYLGEIFVMILRAVINKQHSQEIIELSEWINQSLTIMAEDFELTEAVYLLHILSPVVRGAIYANSKDYSHPGLLDAWMRWPISILLGFSRNFLTITSESIHQQMNNIAWDKLETLYATKMPRDAVKKLEYLLKTIQFEQAVEGQIITPLWYWEEIIGSSLLLSISESIEALIEIFKMFPTEAASLIEDKQYELAAAAIQRGLEACEKFEYHLGNGSQLAESLADLHRTADIPWPKPDWSKFKGEIDACRGNLASSLARVVNNIGLLPQLEGQPDYFGQAYTFLAEQSYTAMLTGNHKLFEQIFPSFFQSCFIARQRVMKRTKPMAGSMDAALVLSTEPILDLLELSGYAILFSELGDKELWHITNKLWDSFLSRAADSKIILISAIAEYRDGVFGVTPRDFVRTKWQQTFEQKLRESGLLSEYGEPLKKVHKSAIIKIITRTGHLFDRPRDIFQALYLSRKSKARGIKWRRSVQ